MSIAAASSGPASAPSAASMAEVVLVERRVLAPGQQEQRLDLAGSGPRAGVASWPSGAPCSCSRAMSVSSMMSPCAPGRPADEPRVGVQLVAASRAGEARRRPRPATRRRRARAARRHRRECAPRRPDDHLGGLRHAVERVGDAASRVPGRPVVDRLRSPKRTRRHGRVWPRPVSGAPPRASSRWRRRSDRASTEGSASMSRSELLVAGGQPGAAPGPRDREAVAFVRGRRRRRRRPRARPGLRSARPPAPAPAPGDGTSGLRSRRIRLVRHDGSVGSGSTATSGSGSGTGTTATSAGSAGSRHRRRVLGGRRGRRRR